MSVPFGWRALEPEERDDVEREIAERVVDLVFERGERCHRVERVRVLREIALALGARGVAVKACHGDRDLDREAEAVLWPDPRLDVIAALLRGLPPSRLEAFSSWLVEEIALEVQLLLFVVLHDAVEGDAEAEKRLDAVAPYGALAPLLNALVRGALTGEPAEVEK